MSTVFEMVGEVLRDSRSKLSAEETPAIEKTASYEVEAEPDHSDFIKLADACDYLAENIHLVNDNRTPQEKLAEYSAVSEALAKLSVEGGTHQTQTANAEDIPPKNPPLDSGVGPGGPSSAMVTAPATTPGTSLDAGQSGEAMGAHVTPKVPPVEKPRPLDAANALATNEGMMMPEQPEAILKQSSDWILQKVKLAKIVKKAEDALNPASVSGGSAPLLQSSAGVPSPLSQGSEVGENTPRETAPTTGEAAGRHIVASNESVINVTKKDAKTQNTRAAVGQLLTETALASSGDKVLQESLDNTSSAGVKISAARELLRKFAEANPENAQRVSAIVKQAMLPEEEGVAPEAPAAPAPVPQAPPAVGVNPPSPEALEAAESGVTPEELEEAEALLASQEEAAMQAAAAPEAGVMAAPEEEAPAPAPAQAAQPAPSPAPVPAAQAPQA